MDMTSDGKVPPLPPTNRTPLQIAPCRLVMLKTESEALMVLNIKNGAGVTGGIFSNNVVLDTCFHKHH